MTGVGIYMDGQDGRMSGVGLTPRPPLQHLERGWRPWNRGRGVALDCGLRRNDGGTGLAITRRLRYKTYTAGIGNR